MSRISRFTTWSDIKTLQASALNNEFNNIVNIWNNTDAGITPWTTLYVVTRLQIGTIPSTQTPAPLLFVSSVINWASINFDNIRDLSVISPQDNTTAFSSYDTSVQATGTNNYDHLSGYQDRILFLSSGTLNNQWSFYSQPTFSGGTVTDRYAVRVRDPLGVGVLTNNYGLFVEALSRGSNNYGVYVTGPTPSYLGGPTTVVGSLSATSTSGNHIHGVSDSTSPNAGDVGEVLTSAVGTTSMPSSTNLGDLTSIPVTVGHWLISANINYGLNSAVALTNVSGGIGTVTGNDSTGLVVGDTYLFQTAPSATTNTSITIANWETKLNSPTTYYLKMRGVYSSGTPQASGRITAVRVS